MWKEQFLALARYNRIMNDKLYRCVSQLTTDQIYEDRGAFFKSAGKTLEHIWGADWIWLNRFRQRPDLKEVLSDLDQWPPVTSLKLELFDSFDELTTARRKLDEIILRFTENLNESDFNEVFRYRNIAGQSAENLFWVYITHFFNHQTHHRGQVTTLLSQFGYDVGVTDFPFVLKEAP